MNKSKYACFINHEVVGKDSNTAGVITVDFVSGQRIVMEYTVRGGKGDGGEVVENTTAYNDDEADQIASFGNNFVGKIGLYAEDVAVILTGSASDMVKLIERMHFIKDACPCCGSEDEHEQQTVCVPKKLPRGFRRCECSCGGFLGVFAADDDHGGIAALCPKCRKSIFIHNQVLMFPRRQKAYYKNGTAVFS